MMVVMNADDGKVIQSFPISAGADAEVYDEKTGLIFVSTREGSPRNTRIRARCRCPARFICWYTRTNEGSIW